MPLASQAFNAQVTSLGALLSGSHNFVIPIFQRSYSWTSREVAQLLTDLWIGIEEGRERGLAYRGLFLGSMVVLDPTVAAANEPAERGEAYLVIDGKQRLTTLTVLLAVLRDRIADRAPWIEDLLTFAPDPGQPSVSLPRLKLGLEEGAYFGVQVYRPGATLSPIEPDDDHAGRRRIRECQLTIFDDCEVRNDEDLLALATFLRDEVLIALISAPDVDAAYRVFVGTNHRGKPLSPTDILKAELMAGVPESEREATLERWHTTEMLLDKDFDQLPGFLYALQSHRHGPQIIGVLELSRQHGGAPRFLNEVLFPLADALYPILNACHMGSPHSERINRSLRMLGWLKARDWVPPVLGFMGLYKDQPGRLAEYLEALELLAFAMHIAGIGGDQRVVRYRAVLEALKAGMLPDGSQSPLALSQEDQEALLSKANGGLHRRSPGTCKYLLKRISASYPGDVLNESLGDFSVEHVLPTNLSNNSPWIKIIPDPDERAACNRLLGNFVLISKQQNKEAKNQGFDIKLRVYFPHGQPSPHAITNQLIGFRTWNAVDIRTREAMLISRLRQIVGIPDNVGPARKRKSKRT